MKKIVEYLTKNYFFLRDAALFVTLSSANLGILAVNKSLQRCESVVYERPPQGYYRVLRELHSEGGVERLVNYGSRAGIEIADVQGKYTAVFPSDHDLLRFSEYLRRLPPGSRSSALAALDVDKNGELSRQELSDLLDKQ